jgi:hypothetical protein
MHNPVTATRSLNERDAPRPSANGVHDTGEAPFAPLFTRAVSLVIATVPTPGRLADRRRQPHPRPPAIGQPDEAPSEPASHLLEPRPEDLGASWPAHAHRCRQELPAELAWAAPLLDHEHPEAVRCGREQACRLIVWHHHLPTYEQVSFTCQRLTRATGPARPAGR